MSETFTPETQAALISILKSRQKQSAVQSILTSGTEAVSEFMLNGLALAAIAACGTAMGGGVDLIQNNGATQPGMGFGLLIGGFVVGARVIYDLSGFELADRDRPSKPKPKSSKGLEVWSDDGSMVLLLPDVDTKQVLRMAQRTASLYKSGRAKHNFSKRELGKPFGDHLSDVKKKLVFIGHLEDTGVNGIHAFTPAGVQWLEEMLK